MTSLVNLTWMLFVYQFFMLYVGLLNRPLCSWNQQQLSSIALQSMWRQWQTSKTYSGWWKSGRAFKKKTLSPNRCSFNRSPAHTHVHANGTKHICRMNGQDPKLKDAVEKCAPPASTRSQTHETTNSAHQVHRIKMRINLALRQNNLFARIISFQRATQWQTATDEAQSLRKLCRCL